MDDSNTDNLIPNPNYVEGGPYPKFIAKSTITDDKPLEAPYIDPVSIAASAATGGLSGAGSALMNATKNKATSAVTGSLLDRIKLAAQNSKVSGPATQVGSNTMYQPSSPPINYQQQILQQLRDRGKLNGSGG